MEGVPGVHAFLEQPKASKLQARVQNMCEWNRFKINSLHDKGFYIKCTFCFRKSFPGSQPVSMDCTNLWNLNKRPYRVSWKADGTR